MKFCLLFSTLFAFFSLHAQVESYDFAQTIPPGSAPVNSVEPSFYGLYSNPDSNLKYEISDSGIVIISTQYSHISRKTLRESSQYEVRNGYIFGVEAQDSLPCFLDGEDYYFGVRNRTVLIGNGSKNVLTRLVAGTYYINFYERGAYVPAKLVFGANSFDISYFDYSSDTLSLKSSVAQATTVPGSDPQVTRLQLTNEEWLKLNMQLFGAVQSFRKSG